MIKKVTVTKEFYNEKENMFVEQDELGDFRLILVTVGDNDKNLFSNMYVDVDYMKDLRDFLVKVIEDIEND